jgi:nucleotide-binding universal stress UspA family protein
MTTEQRTTPIVVGVDGSRTALAAVHWAATEAAQQGVPLAIVHAAPYLDARAAAAAEHRAKTILARAWSDAVRHAPGVDAHTELQIGEPAVTLARLSADARLLVLGLTGSGRPEELIIGSTALQLVGHARCPVVGVRAGHTAPCASRDVVVGVESVDGDADVLEAAFDRAARCGLRLVVVLVGQHGTDKSQLDEQFAGWRSQHPSVEVEFLLDTGRPEESLLRWSTRAETVLVGNRGRSALTRAIMGSTLCTGKKPRRP